MVNTGFHMQIVKSWLHAWFPVSCTFVEAPTVGTLILLSRIKSTLVPSSTLIQHLSEKINVGTCCVNTAKS